MIKIISLKVKKSVLSKVAGDFKQTDLSDDIIWKEVLKKKSRKRKVAFFLK
ncbi:hypothetical protein HY612_05190 [Candidatus Roizmanbacteria bacterium]|nr:hypothetical protein [Candidatus Roizmanbacteria bacterium]